MQIYVAKYTILLKLSIHSPFINIAQQKQEIYGFVRQKQVSRAGISNYTPQIKWDLITFPCPWTLLLATQILVN